MIAKIHKLVYLLLLKFSYMTFYYFVFKPPNINFLSSHHLGYGISPRQRYNPQEIKFQKYYSRVPSETVYHGSWHGG